MEAYYLAAVVGGAGSFAMPAADYKDFATAIRAKLIREISGELVIGERLAPRASIDLVKSRRNPGTKPKSAVKSRGV